jgi:endonuclease/exonuclease/phosphatase family metal-dependent hydrolase
MKKLSWFNRVVFTLNIGFASLLAIALVIPYVPTKIFPTLFVVSLIVPFLAILNFLFLLYWVLVRKRQFLLSGILLVLWFMVLSPFYQLASSEVKKTKEIGAISIMTFNARSFNDLKQLRMENVDSLIYDFVKESDPDVVCFQETLYAMKRNGALSQYPYKFVDFIYGKHRGGKVIQSIYSKYPIVHIDSIVFPKSANNAIYADIAFLKDTIRIYNVHLQSFRIVPGLQTIKNEESSKLFAKTSRAMLKQYEQANLIRENMDRTKHKKIVVGDFNNTQYSNVFHIIKGNMNDTYFEKGTGFGRTYDLLKFPIRIDYILADPDFEVLSHQNFNIKLSDHYPVMSTLRLKSHQ